MEPSIAYAHQTPDDLDYRLLACPAPRELVRVLVERRLRLPGGEVALAIIGSSHFMEIRARSAVVTEMLASSRPELSGLPQAERVQTGGGRSAIVAEGLSYRFEMESRRYSPEAFVRQSERVSREVPDRLCYRFPALDGEPGAVTCLDWRVDAGELILETYHTFPGQWTVVRSRTEVGFPEMGVVP